MTNKTRLRRRLLALRRFDKRFTDLTMHGNPTSRTPISRALHRLSMRVPAARHWWPS